MSDRRAWLMVLRFPNCFPDGETLWKWRPQRPIRIERITPEPLKFVPGRVVAVGEKLAYTFPKGTRDVEVKFVALVELDENGEPQAYPGAEFVRELT